MSDDNAPDMTTGAEGTVMRTPMGETARETMGQTAAGGSAAPPGNNAAATAGTARGQTGDEIGGESGAGAGNKAEVADWTSALPESLREAAKSAGSPEALQAALKHGLAHNPLSRVEDVRIEAPKGAALDEEGARWFKETAVKAGLSNAQVRALVEDYNAQAATLQEGMRRSAEAELRAEYGHGYEVRLSKAQDVCRRFNKLTDGGLDPILQSGLGNHPGFIRFMMAISDTVSESGMPGNSQTGGPGPMSTEDFLKYNVFNNN